MIKKIFFIIIYFCFFLSNAYPQVFQQWVNRSDSVNARYIAVDNIGRVYVAGMIEGDNSDIDIVVFCLASSGELIWESIYEGIDELDDIPKGLAVTRNGKVFVAGYSKVGPSNEDILLVKFGVNGVIEWWDLYDADGKFDDGYSISANEYEVWVTGEAGIYPGSDCVTLLYNANTGNIMHEMRYGDSLDNVGLSIVSDKIHAIVTGFKNVSIGNPDYMTIKYNDAGQQLWVKYYHGQTEESNDIAHFIALDTFYNYCYVTGESGNGLNTDFATVSYDEFGNERWVKRYNGTGNYIDVGKFVALDKSGNVIITGYSAGTSLSTDIVTIKYDRFGSQLWVNRYDGPTADNDRPNGLAVDDSGNVYIAGETVSGNSTRYLTLKYNSTGVLQWTQFYEFSVGGIHYASCIALDRRRNVYVSGLSQGTNTYDAATIKYSPSNNTTINIRKHSLSKFIPDNSFLLDTIRMEGFDLPSSNVIDVDVILDTIIHPYDDDLEITLTHLGVTDTLVYRCGGSGDNFIGTYLDDLVSYPISSGTAPFNEDFKPSTPLNRFSGLEANGDWILKIYDRSTGNTGILQAWSLVLTAITPIGISTISSEIPSEFNLHQNYPNPFNPVTNIRFEVPKSKHVKLSVYDVLGREITTLVNSELIPGIYEVQFHGGNLSSGIYFCQLTSENFISVKKMIVVK